MYMRSVVPCASIRHLNGPPACSASTDRPVRTGDALEDADRSAGLNPEVVEVAPRGRPEHRTADAGIQHLVRQVSLDPLIGSERLVVASGVQRARPAHNLVAVDLQRTVDQHPRRRQSTVSPVEVVGVERHRQTPKPAVAGLQGAGVPGDVDREVVAGLGSVGLSVALDPHRTALGLRDRAQRQRRALSDRRGGERTGDDAGQQLRRSGRSRWSSWPNDCAAEALAAEAVMTSTAMEQVAPRASAWVNHTTAFCRSFSVLLLYTKKHR